MKVIVLHGTECLYLIKNEAPLPLYQIGDMTLYLWSAPRFMENQISQSNNIRAMVIPSHSQLAYFEYIYWYLNDIDLDKLDKRIDQGQSIELEAYFENIAATQYQITRCNDGCKKRFHTLKLNALTTLPGGFNRRAIKEGPLHILNCPSCGKSFRQQVIKIFAESIEPSD